MTHHSRKDRFRRRPYYDSTPPGFNESNLAYLCLQWDHHRIDGRFFWMLTKAIYRVAAARGIPPSRVTGDVLVDWYSSRWWARLGQAGRWDCLNRSEYRRIATTTAENRLVAIALDAVYGAMSRKAG